MRVLLVTGSYPPMRCGVGDYTHQLVLALSKLPGLTVGVLTGCDAAYEQDSNITVYPFMDRWFAGEMYRIARVLREFRADIVHVQSPTQGYRSGLLPSLVPLLARFYGARAIRTWHEIPSWRSGRSYLVQMLGGGGYIVVRPNFIRGLPRGTRWVARLQRCRFIPGAAAIPRSNLDDAALRALRARYLRSAQRLIVYFGFLHHAKGPHRVFDIADSERDQLLFIGQPLDPAYGAQIADRANREPWKERASLLGYLPATDTAALLKAADAVVLPFLEGGGSWNSSIEAAVRQGTPVITTSRSRRGLDTARLVDSSAPDDLAGMRNALDRLAGQRREIAGDGENSWQAIAKQHVAFYREVVGAA